MSHSADPRAILRRLFDRHTDDEGFTLVEVIVALVIFALAASASAGLLITMLKTSYVAKLDTGAKTLSQERLESMRNLPYHIDYDVNGTAVTNKSDLFDSYYPNLTQAGVISGSTIPQGYVTAAQTGATYRLSSEPATGPFYRTVINPVPGFTKYRQYIAVQLLNSNRSPVTPPASFNSQVSGADYPPAPLVGVNVVTKWTAGSVTHQLVVATEIADARPANPLVTLQGQISALKLTSALGPDRDVTVELGGVSLNGALSSGVTAATKTDAAYAQISPGQRLDGASQAASGPPDMSLSSASAGAQTLTDTGTAGTPLVACFGGSSSSNVSAKTSSGQPVVGSSTSPVTSTVSGSGCSSYSALMSNEPSPDSRLQIDTTKPMVFATGGGGSTVATGAGWLASSAGASHVASFSGSAATGTFSVLPTTFAPNGLLQVTLNSAALTCQTGGTSATAGATPTYSATIKYWKYAAGGGSYQTLSLSSSQSADPLSPLLATDGTGVQVGVDSSGNALWLGNYIANWASATSASLGQFGKIDPDFKSLTGSTAGVVSITTMPTRASDPTSSIALQLAPMSCQAEDNR